MDLNETRTNVAIVSFFFLIFYFSLNGRVGDVLFAKSLTINYIKKEQLLKVIPKAKYLLLKSNSMVRKEK